jgi:hypothetical protein
LIVAAAWIAESSFVVVFFSVCVCVCVCVFLGLADAAVGGGLLCGSSGDLGVLHVLKRILGLEFLKKL